MLSVVIPTKDSEEALARTLAELVPAAADGTVREVIVVDAGSTDGTATIADGAGCTFLNGPADIGARLALGAEAASRGDYLLCLMPGVVPSAGWEADLAALVDRLDRRGKAGGAMIFRYAVDDVGLMAGLQQAAVRLLGWLGGVPHADQGLLLPHALLRSIGGFRPLGSLSLVDVAHRVGTRRTNTLRATASRISPDGSGGWLPGGRPLGTLALLLLLALRLPPALLRRLTP